MISWKNILEEESKKDYFKLIIEKVTEDAKTHEVYPSKDNLFTAFKLTSYQNTKVLILSQDPYHNPGQAHGLSFSVLPGITPPPSLKNIFKELKNDLNIDPPNHGFLESWAKQGILLLNSILTVRKNDPGSHKDFGWQTFTDTIISHLNNKETPTVFILWGAFAKSKKKLITNNHHLILESNHPSPFSAYNGFFNSKPFSKTNNFLIANDIEAIDWRIPHG